VASCDVADPAGVVSLHITPNYAGVQDTQCVNVVSDSNASSYYLNISAPKSTLDHNPVLTPTNATIVSTAAALSSPTTLSVNTWGFAIPSGQTFLRSAFTNFNNLSAYQTNPDTATFAAIPVVSPAPDLSCEYWDKDGIQGTDPCTPHTSYTFAEINDLTPGDETFKVFFSVKANSQQPSGTYQNIITITAIAEEAPEPIEPTPAPPTDFATKATAIVPNFASTITPEQGSAPVFSVSGSGFSGSTTITIGGQPCTVVSYTTNALTCSGPTSGMTDGAKTVAINGVPQNSSYDVWYSSFAFPTLQSMDSTACSALPAHLTASDGNVSVYRDTRDSQLYYIAKMADNKCWMLDNLRYKPTSLSSGSQTNNWPSTTVNQKWTGYLTVDNTNDITTDPTNQNYLGYADPITNTYCRGNNTPQPTQTITRCGLLYNWYTTTAGTGDSNISSTGGTQATGSVCPANWRLPSAYSGTGGPTTNGTSYTVADFPVLNISMRQQTLSTGATTNDATTYPNWQPSGVFAGVFSGGFYSGFGSQGSNGFLWSSSVHNAAGARGAYWYASYVNPGNSSANRDDGRAVRCVL